MSSQLPSFLRSAALGAVVGAAILVGGAPFGAATPASAQSMSWEAGCAERVVTPGPGDALRAFNCARQKECQQMANAKGGMMMDMGCFGVSPSASQVPAGAVRSRPERQQ